MKARLPLAPQRARTQRAAAPAGRARERVPATRTLLCVFDSAAPGRALDFACGVLERARASGCAAAALLLSDAVRAGDARRLRALDVTLSTLPERSLPDAALQALAQLPEDAIVVALGAPFAAHVQALLTVRVGACAGPVREAECDLEVAHDDGLLATLIGDWIAARIRRVSVEDHASAAKKTDD